MHKKLSKILTISFLLIFTLQLASLLFLITMPEPSIAAEVKNFVPQVSIDDNFTAGVFSTPSIAKYIKAIYTYAIGIVGILAAIVLMFGGVLWITAGGNNERISNAKSWIAASLSGLVLALCSYMILYTINPNLVQFKDIVVNDVTDTSLEGCCLYVYKLESSCKDKKKSDCIPPSDNTTADWIGSNYKCNETKKACEAK